MLSATQLTAVCTGALGAKAPKMPAAHLSKYNRFVDSIIGRINEVLKKSFDPVTVRLTRGSPPPSRRPVKNDPKHNSNAKIGEEGPTYELVAVSRNEDLPLGRSSIDNVETPAVVPARRPKHARRNKNKSNKQSNRQRARATLIGLASLRRDGDVTVNSMSEHTTVRSRFLLGPLVLRVEKQFGRGAKKELRSATATTDKMTGRMVLRVNSEGVAKLHSIRVLQPKQVRVESEDNHDRTREFVWRRSSHIASLVSQKLTKAARDLLQTKPEPAERQ
ncbi:hypothetical protein B566_EDAN012095 [Ephemera danica]|nr:hypothetical protein B566_EDAN012095 [Ephemera danica]